MQTNQPETPSSNNSNNNSTNSSNNVTKKDFLIFGTGLVETVIAYKLSKMGKSVLVIDKSNYYGGEFSTLTYKELTERMRRNKTNSNTKNDISSSSNNDTLLALSRDFNIDLTPKLLLMESPLKDLFVEEQIDQMVNFTTIMGSYFYSDKLHSIPRNEKQSMTSGALSFFQKTKVARFFYNLRSISNSGTNCDNNANNSADYKFIDNINVNYPFKPTMADEFKQFSLDKSAIDFIGHGIALYTDDSYLSAHPAQCYSRILRYIQSITSYDNSESPFIYPQYGLSDICQAFVRKASCHGGEFMLEGRIEQIDTLKKKVGVVDQEGVRHEIEYGKIVSDPSYFVLKEEMIEKDKEALEQTSGNINIEPENNTHNNTDSNTSTGNTLLYNTFTPSMVSRSIIRCIMICNKNPKFTGSRNITFSHSALGRSSDIFSIILDNKTKACPENYEIGILSTEGTLDNTTVNSTDSVLSPILKKFDLIEYFTESRLIYTNTDTDSVFFTENVDESPLMDKIYEDIERVMEKILK